MPSPTEYRGKHVKGVYRYGVNSRTSRGPERWARAAHNALVNPLSAAAKLYNDRVATARRFVDYEEARLPFQHDMVAYTGDSSMDVVRRRERKYVTCNIVCAAMQTQLDIGTTAFYDVADALAGNFRRTYMWRGTRRRVTQQMETSVLDPTTLKRDVRCQVCGTTVKRG